MPKSKPSIDQKLGELIRELQCLLPDDVDIVINTSDIRMMISDWDKEFLIDDGIEEQIGARIHAAADLADCGTAR